MAIELVTGYQGMDHVTADQWADFNRGIFGKDTILPVGNRMETAIQTANQITVKDGVAVIDGRQVYIGYGESENIVIQSGTQGMLRRDIVVLEYNRDESGIESVAFKVITGEPKASDAVDPSVENTDIRTGVSSSQKPFCRVRLNGTAIEGVDALIPVREFQPHAFEDTVKDFTTTETGHVPDATLTKKLKDEVTKLNGDLGKIKYLGTAHTGENGGTKITLPSVIPRNSMLLIVVRSYNGSTDLYPPYAFLVFVRPNAWRYTLIGESRTEKIEINDGYFSLHYKSTEYARAWMYQIAQD